MRIQGAHLGILGIRGALSRYLFRHRRGQEIREWYVKPKSHGAVDNKSNSSRKEVFILPACSRSLRNAMQSPTVRGEFSAIEIREYPMKKRAFSLQLTLRRPGRLTTSSRVLLTDEKQDRQAPTVVGERDVTLRL